jgi:hypothetical protein
MFEASKYLGAYMESKVFCTEFNVEWVDADMKIAKGDECSNLRFMFLLIMTQDFALFIKLELFSSHSKT